MASKKVRMSAEGLANLEKELEYLVTVRRVEVAQKLKEARSFGDLSENAEYDEAKNEQAILEAEIKEKEITIANAEVVDDDDIKSDQVSIGSYVKLKDLEYDEILDIQIVGSTEADADKNKISDESPVGLAVMNKKAGETVEVETPGGLIQMQILEISRKEKEA